MNLPKIPVKLIIFACFIGAIVGLGAFVWLIKFTHSGTRFGKVYCMTCHKHQGRSEFWRDSTLHPANVTCAECHAKPGEFIPKKFCASQELMNENCIRCHEEMQYNNDWEGLKTNVLKIKIQHGVHIDKANARCTDCHNNISHDSSPEPTNRPHMTKCFDCHDLQQTSCDTCHPEKIYPEPLVAGVSINACNTCHIDFIHKSVQPDYPNFQHQKHLLMLMDCKDCHVTTEPHPKTVVSKLDCLNCHHKEMDTKACTDCHVRQFKLYHGEKFAGIKGHENPMLKVGMSCELGCHKDIDKGHSVDTVKQWCIGCHGEGYGQLLDEWRATIGSHTDEVKALLTVAEQKICSVGKDDEQCVRARCQIDAARASIDLVDRGKGGAHNFEFSQKILDDAHLKLQNTIQELTKHEGEMEPGM